jgi:hypothetical protein
MKAKRTFITEPFLAKVRTTGSLAEAMQRMKAHGEAKYEPLPKMTTWGLICEEIVDTEHRPEHYERCVAELRRRGFTDEKIHEMRDFAWRTAGWFNFEKMVWDWCALDEDDIRKALEWQEKDGEITPEERREKEGFLNRFDQKRAGQSAAPLPSAPAGPPEGAR